jgi:ABC-type multidrug transport system fused ATPase/permease subunit
MAIYDTYKFEFLFGGACQLIASLAQILTPFVMKYLIQFSSEAYFAAQGRGAAPPIGEGIGLVFGITAMQMLMSLTTNHFIYRGMMVGGQARSVLISVIFDKAMRLSGRARAGGLAEKADDEKPNFKPGSKEEKKYLKKKLSDAQNGISGDGVGWSNGRIVNLMSTDTYRVDQASGLFHMIWTAPIQVILTLILLLINITYSALSGFAFIVIMMPLLGQAIKSLMYRRRFINKVTDQRVTLTQEIISSVRFVKFFGWETSFLDRLANIRKQEVDKITKLLSIRNAILAVSLSLPIFASMLAFITYSLSGHGLAPAPIFSSLALFNSLRIPLNLLPMVIGQIVDASASIKRIQEFLDAEESPVEATFEEKAPDAIDIQNGSFTWERTRTQDTDDKPAGAAKPPKPTKQEKKDAKVKEKELKKLEKRRELEKVESDPSSPTDPDNNSMQEKEKRPFEITGINLSIGRDELVAVIGSVGSGKSSLLAALAGDMRKTNGNVTFGASRAFCPQYAWIQNATVKENITFSKPYDRRWYNEVVDACALRPDLEMLPAGDMTEIGERGITVSGGQKQRLNIARAIYFNADIVIMDDPLSAVDAHVGKHIMDEAICGLLKGKARVLATHQLHVLHRADRIVWMKEGRIAKIATFPDLMENDEEFQSLMKTTASEEEVEEAAEVLEDEGEAEKKVAAKKAKKAKKSAVALMQQEERAVNSVSSSVYMSYVKASGSIAVLPIILLLLITSQGSNIVTSLWLSWWTSDKFRLDEGVYIGVYAAFGVLQALLTFAFATTLTYFGTKASRVMLQRAIYRVLRAPMSFFDTTPMGRITNRFSKDVDTMDNVLTDSIRMFSLTFVTIISVFILIIAYYYYFVIALVPLTFMFCFSAGYYRASARELKRHEANLRSVVFARFSEAVNGTSTIRAYGVEQQFATRLAESLDSMDGAYYLTFANQRWLSVRLDFMGNLLVFTCGILVVTARFNIDPSTGGLVLSYILSIVQMIQFSVRQLAEVENNMNSTERIHYYGTQLEEEAPLKLGEVRSSWPERGEIVFEDVQMRYRAGLPLVLKGMNMTVKSGERIGIVGRTGAGKSTIMSTLFRLTELSGGSITIDGVDISTIGLADLRSRLAIIPQDPTLFRGTIRSNLDPFHEHTDLELWHALRQADLVGPEQTLEEPSTTSSTSTSIVPATATPIATSSTARIHLDTPVEDEGLNFSLGQRQLLALARALVRGSQIIVCDEATSSVDFETDQKIQRTIVRGFSGKTLLCIAHRLRTIIGYDRILVMDQGNVAELDSPLRLFETEGSIFRGMCERSGIRREDFLRGGEEVREAVEGR